MRSLINEKVVLFVLSFSFVFCVELDGSTHNQVDDSVNTPLEERTYFDSSSHNMLDFSGCGKQTRNPFLYLIRKIVNGITAVSHSWPWQVLLFADGEPTCGGTILTNNVIITAAHCVITENRLIAADRFKIGFGLHNRFYTPGGFYINVSYVFPHPGFLASNKDFDDLAILFLRRYIPFGPSTRPICLPNPGEQPQVDEYCVVTGWGATVNEPLTEEETNPWTLRQAEVHIVSDASCQEAYRFQYPIDGHSHICAGGNGTDSCQGDSGGPLQCKRANGTWYLAGITSWGDECGGTTPGVYTQVEYYLEWINMFI